MVRIKLSRIIDFVQVAKRNPFILRKFLEKW